MPDDPPPTEPAPPPRPRRRRRALDLPGILPRPEAIELQQGPWTPEEEAVLEDVEDALRDDPLAKEEPAAEDAPGAQTAPGQGAGDAEPRPPLMRQGLADPGVAGAARLARPRTSVPRWLGVLVAWGGIPFLAVLAWGRLQEGDATGGAIMVLLALLLLGLGWSILRRGIAHERPAPR